ncbi:PRC-barrel domain-containing protein [Enemella sp. A6]|uniref:PRC-barrel domain-containing protein n=1 Tax=Enemella sp. A6 TaxID=3440152 RepID=UPI003EB7E24B
MDITDVNRLRSAVVYAQGEKVGSVHEVFVDDETDRPSWATVSTGLFGTKMSFVPIDDARLVDDDRLEVSTDKDTIKDAPRIDVDEHLSRDEERRLYEHYGRSTRYTDLETRRADRTAAGMGRDRTAEGTYDLGADTREADTMGTRPQVTEDFDRPREHGFDGDRIAEDEALDRDHLERDVTPGDDTVRARGEHGTERVTSEEGYLRVYRPHEDTQR